jgi:acyl-CoA synthetase (AMP-forming)/AMP-acid ligase II
MGRGAAPELILRDRAGHFLLTVPQTAMTEQFASWVEVLQAQASLRPNKVAFTFLADGERTTIPLTYQQLDQQARGIAAELAIHAAPGSRVLLLYPQGLEFIAGFFGCLYAGMVGVPITPPLTQKARDRIDVLVRDADPSVVLTTAAVRSRLLGLSDRGSPLNALPCIATEALDPATGATWCPPAAEGTTLAFLQYTSGSTGDPKGVMVSHGNLLSNAALIAARFEVTSRSSLVSWLPTFHDMGLIGCILTPIFVGMHCVLLTPLHFLQRPARWLQAISRYRTAIAGGPNFAYDLCARRVESEAESELDLSEWRVAFNGSERVRGDTLARFTRRFGAAGFRREAFFPTYGLAEATLLVSGGPQNRPPPSLTVLPNDLELHRVTVLPESAHSGIQLVGCGCVALGQRVVVVDPESAVLCPEGTVGEIWVHGPSVAQGYWRKPIESAETFGAMLASSGPELFLRTGDLGFIYCGELYVTGRLKEVIIIRGLNHYPQDIEATLERSDPACAVGSKVAFTLDGGGEERLAVAVELEAHAGHDFHRLASIIRREILLQHGLAVELVLFARRGLLPKTTSGKIQRSRCRADFLAGQLPVLFASRLDQADGSSQRVPRLRGG